MTAASKKFLKRNFYIVALTFWLFLSSQTKQLSYPEKLIETRPSEAFEEVS